ncbi:MAG: glutamine synthetase III [Planctomycetota bacterium]|nr:glutamine synthetase III [Planctomycetota bacterium]
MGKQECCCGCGSESVAESFGSDCFNLKTMKEYLSERVFTAIQATIRDGAPLNPAIADEVANGMRTWALKKGATHFTHWFQPLTGSTAEKHEAFIFPDFNGGVISQFTGKDLVQGEPDASSFPSGGIRATFEARGYTAWDPTSHAFVSNADTARAVLCIPCVFCGYNGEALDVKTPLLRSQAALVKQLKRVGEIFAVPETSRPHATLGPEQEYFLIDKALYDRRPDIAMCGRTLFGRRPARHQQMEDHYFGRIKPRILDFMADVDFRLWRLGVPGKTRHNEVSPAQFELAPVFEEQNLSVDHNLVVMQTLQDTARDHGLVCLLHEKPFAGVNGSGKHNNWAIVGTDGKNWFAPGETPHENAKFLFMVVATLKAIDTHAAAIRASVAFAGNDHRLGANEAPPAILSVYLGDQLEDIIDQIEAGGVKSSKKGGSIEIGVSTLPVLARDVTDRNRTSPFAFTGNKFEFRAVGSSQSCAEPNTILNLAMANALDEMCGELLAKLPGGKPPHGDGRHTKEFHSALQAVLQETVKAHKRVVYAGDGYVQSWQEEAARRGLPNLRSTPEALEVLLKPETIKLYKKYGVLSERESKSRYEVYIHAWKQIVEMEGGCALDLARTFILPAALEQEGILAASLETAKSLGRGDKARAAAYAKVAGLVEGLYQTADALEQALADDAKKVTPALASLREIVDQLEALCPDRIWPFPCYGEMFFQV